MDYESILAELASERDDIVVMTAENRAAIRNLPSTMGSRYIDVGICEQTMIGAAAGLALRGRRPVVHALATFLTLRAFEFIRTDVGIGALPVKLVGGVPGVLSEANGPTHQAIEDVALMRGIPGMGVFCPADADELAAGLRAVVESPQPFYIRHNPTPSIVEHREPFAIGRAETFGDGTDVAILVYGFLFAEAIRAREILEERGIAARVVNLRTVVPIDSAAIVRSVDECSLVVTLEDHFLVGGLYSIVAEWLLARERTARVLPIAFDARWFRPALLRDVLEYERLSAAAIADRIVLRLDAKAPVTDETASTIAMN
jgi:transketolase